MKYYQLFSRRLASFTLLMSMLMILSCSRNPVTGKKQLSLMSEQQEIALGQQSDPGIVASFGKYEDAALQNFIKNKGQSMASISHRKNLKFEFKILDSPVVNAFAVPGGYVYFTRGIMAHFNNEAEFAGVLGHEIGHISAKHSSRQYTTQVLGQILLIGGMVVSPEFRQFGDVASQSMGMLFMKFGRDHESESDKLGVEYSTKIGYDAHQMGDFFNTLHRLSTSDGREPIPTFLSTHPDPLDRYAKVHEMATTEQKKVGKPSYTVGRDSYLQMIDGLTYGEDPRQGFVENGYFYHPELKFQYKLPSNWQVNNTPAQVQMGEPNGKAAMFMSLGQGNNLQEALNNEMNENKLTLLEQSNKNVNGLPAIAAISEQVGQNQQGQQIKIKVLSYFIQYENLIYKFNGMTYDELFSQFAPVFENSMKTFKKLTDTSKLNKKADKIKIQKVPSTMTLQQAFSRFNMPSSRHEELAILNGMELNDSVASGMLIKTISNENGL
jgi:predicted Zn-dependent protease